MFCNPPYSAVSEWAKKASEEIQNPGTLVVMLVYARTDTKWFHNYCLPYAEIRFIKGRIKFGGAEYNAPFPSILIIFRSKDLKQQEVKT